MLIFFLSRIFPVTPRIQTPHKGFAGGMRLHLHLTGWGFQGSLYLTLRHKIEGRICSGNWFFFHLISLNTSETTPSMFSWMHLPSGFFYSLPNQSESPIFTSGLGLLMSNKCLLHGFGYFSSFLFILLSLWHTAMLQATHRYWLYHSLASASSETLIFDRFTHSSEVCYGRIIGECSCGSSLLWGLGIESMWEKMSLGDVQCDYQTFCQRLN